jgi:hypothetical protein
MDRVKKTSDFENVHDEVTEYFNLTYPSSRTTALGLTEPLTEMSTMNLPGGKELPARA